MIENINTKAVRSFDEAMTERNKLIEALVELGVYYEDALSVISDAYELGFNRMSFLARDRD